MIQISRNIIFNKGDTNVYPIPGEEEEETRTCPSPIPTVTITEVNDVNQAPTPNTESAVPSTGMPDPGPQRSGWIANQGTRPDYTNKTRERAMVT